MVGIDTFAQLDIRVGKIISVEDHAAARKPMYKLTVDLGPEIGMRTIIAGVKAKYSAEELQGKLVVCIVNLDPKQIAGIESQGMMLAAGEIENLAILTPDKEIELGAKVR